MRVVGSTTFAPSSDTALPARANLPATASLDRLERGIEARVTTLPPQATKPLPPWAMELTPSRLAQLAEACAQQLGPASPAAHLVFSDADHTFLQTNLPLLLAHKQTNVLLRHPVTGRRAVLGRVSADYEGELSALQKKHPNVAWHDYAWDFRFYDSPRHITRSAPIDATIDSLKTLTRQPSTVGYVVTARSCEHVGTEISAYLAQRGVDVAGTIPVNQPGWFGALGLQEANTAVRKAFTMAGLIGMHGAQAVQRVTYFEDADANLVAGMQLLPALFPHIHFKFVDVVHQGHHQFVHKVAGQSSARGLVDGLGRLLTQRDIATYASNDAPFHIPA